MTVLQPGMPIYPPDDGSRITAGFVLLPLGEVVPTTDEPGQPLCLVDAQGERVTVYDGFLQHIWAGGSLNSVRSMAYALLRWHRLVTALGLTPETADRSEIRDVVLYLRQAENPQRARSRKSGTAAPGSLNRRTGKRMLSAGYSPRTINHQLSVLSSFYTWRIEEGLSLVNPVPRSRASRTALLGPVGQPRRANARHDPMKPFVNGQRAPYRQRVPKRKPRNIPNAHVKELFDGTLHRRDWAMLFCLLWTAVRASELLSLTLDRCDRDRKEIWVVGKGMGGALRMVPAPAALFVYLDAYLAELAERGQVLDVHAPLWWTVVGEPKPLSYQSLRGWFRRSNERLGLNYTVHDLRHTALRRMANDTENFILTDVADIAGHASVETTRIYIEADDHVLVQKVQQHHAKPEADQPAAPDRPEYDPDSLAVVFGTGR